MRKKIWFRVILGISMLPIAGLVMNAVANIEKDKISAHVLELEEVEKTTDLDSSDKLNIEIPKEYASEEPTLELEEPILQELEENEISEEERVAEDSEAILDEPIHNEGGYDIVNEEKEPSHLMTINGLTYTFSGTDGNSTATVTGGTSIPVNLVIPDSVTNSAANWTLPSSVTVVGESAFARKDLQSVKLPKHLYQISPLAFENNNLKSIDFPESIGDISRHAFRNNQLTEVTIIRNGEALRWLGEGAFANNEIKSLTIQDNLPSAGTSSPAVNSNGVFHNNPLEVINVVNSIDSTKGGDVLNIRNNVFTSATLGTVTARTVLRSKTGYNAQTVLTNTKAPGESIQFGVESQFQLNNIADRVWQNYNLDTIKWFKDGKELAGQTSLNLILSNLKSSDSGTYHAMVGTERYPDISLTVEGFTFTFQEEEGVREATVTGYSGTIPTNLVIPDTATNTAAGWSAVPVKRIGSSAFSNKGLQSVKLPKELYQIAAQAFMNNDLKSIDFPESIGDISRQAFLNNQLTEVTILTEKGRVFRWLGEEAFRGNKIETVTIPDNLPNNVASNSTVNSRVFEENPLKTITVVNSSDTTKPTDLTHTRTLLTATRLGAVTERTVLRSKVAGYTAETDLTNTKLSGESIQFEIDSGFQLNNVTNRVWQAYSPSTIKWFKEGQEIIGQNATQLKLSNLQVPDSGVYHAVVGTERYPDINLTVEGFTFAFQDENGSRTATVTGYSGTTPRDLIIPDEALNFSEGGLLPSPVVSIAYGAFQSSRLTSVQIPNTVVSIGGFAFRSNMITNINIPNSVTTIGAYAFSNNVISSLAISNSVKSIGNWAFSENSLFQGVTLPDSNILMGDNVFTNTFLSEIVVFSSDSSNLVNLDAVKNRLTSNVIGEVFSRTILRSKELQYVLGTDLTPTVMEGEQISFEVQPEYQLDTLTDRNWETRTSNIIQWYKGEDMLSGEVSNKLELIDIKEIDSGDYHAQRGGDPYPDIKLTVNLDVEPIIPPVDPNGPNVLPEETNPTIEGLSLRYVSPLNFGTHEFNQQNEVFFSKALKDKGNQSYFPMVTVQDMRPKEERSGWELVVSLEKDLEQGAQIRMSPFIDETYQQNFNVEVAQNKLIIGTNSQRFAGTLVNPNPSGIVSMGMGAGGKQGVELLVPSGMGVGQYSGVLKWELVSGP